MDWILFQFYEFKGMDSYPNQRHFLDRIYRIFFKWNDFLFYFCRFPEESDKPQSPSANTNLILHKTTYI
jgi:hypothetical protein